MVKFSLSKAGKAVQRVAVSAHVYDRVVTAVVKEKLLTYYTSTGAKKVQLRVIGSRIGTL